MKKIILFFAILASAHLIKAQLVVIDTASYQPAAANYYFTVPLSSTYMYSFHVKNTAGSFIKSRIHKTILAATSGHQIGFNYGSAMYVPSVNYSQQEPISAGDSLPDINGRVGLETYFDPGGIAGTSVVRYTVYDSLNHADSVNITVTYNAVVTAMQTQSANNLISNAIPNPASNEFTLQYKLEDASNLSLSIFNSVGAQVKKIPLAGNEGKAKVDLSALTEGFYFYSLMSDGEAVITRRLVITR